MESIRQRLRELTPPSGLDRHQSVLPSWYIKIARAALKLLFPDALITRAVTIFFEQVIDKEDGLTNPKLINEFINRVAFGLALPGVGDRDQESINPKGIRDQLKSKMLQPGNLHYLYQEKEQIVLNAIHSVLGKDPKRWEKFIYWIDEAKKALCALRYAEVRSAVKNEEVLLKILNSRTSNTAVILFLGDILDEQVLASPIIPEMINIIDQIMFGLKAS